MMSILTRVVFSNSLKYPKNQFLSSRFCPKIGPGRPKNRVNSYVLTKYVSLVKLFEDNMKKYFPRGAKFYEVFAVGLKYFKTDCMILYKAYKKVKSVGYTSLSRKELEVYHQLPKDMLRAVPVVMIGAGMPLGGFIFLIAYYLPRQLLTHHFWSDKQKKEFALLSHKRQLEYYKPVFTSMECQLVKLKDEPLRNKMSEVLKILVSGKQPGVDLILSCKELFEKAPYGLQYLPRKHVVALLRIHDMHKGWRRITRLENKALILKLLDTAIVKEGGLEQLNKDEIIMNCFLRGLNPYDMKQEDITNWMTTWLEISKHVDEKSYSLLLHCPILLAQNQRFRECLVHDIKICKSELK